MDIYERSLKRHRETQGKISVTSRMRLESQDDLSIAYTPGVARP
jgi:malate dehydrogenase (oxaloacetate-decarboxylating)